MWRSSCVFLKQSLSSAVRQNSQPLGLLRPLSQASAISAAKSFSRDDDFYHHPAESKDASFERLPFHRLGKELPAYWGKSLGYQMISRGYLTEANRDGYKSASDSSEGVQFQPVLNEMSGDEEQRITSGEVGQLNGLALSQYEGLSEAQLYKKHFKERMKIAMPYGIAPFAICSYYIDGASQMNALSLFDISLQSSALLVNLALFWHINDGLREILADYVHQETTREWISVLFRLFLLIVAKDVFFYFSF